MKNSKLALYGFFDALGTIVYISLVAIIMAAGNQLFGQNSASIIAPIIILSLFVLSAAIVSSLVLGRPILWYLDGQKQEAVKLFLFTLVWLFIFTVAAFVLLAAMPKQMIVY